MRSLSVTMQRREGRRHKSREGTTGVRGSSSLQVCLECIRQRPVSSLSPPEKMNRVHILKEQKTIIQSQARAPSKHTHTHTHTQTHSLVYTHTHTHTHTNTLLYTQTLLGCLPSGKRAKNTRRNPTRLGIVCVRFFVCAFVCVS